MEPTPAMWLAVPHPTGESPSTLAWLYKICTEMWCASSWQKLKKLHVVAELVRVAERPLTHSAIAWIPHCFLILPQDQHDPDGLGPRMKKHRAESQPTSG